MKDQNRSSEDHIGLLLAFIGIGAVTLLMTSAVFVIVLVALLVAWFFGAPRRIAYVCLSLAFITALVVYRSQEAFSFWKLLLTGYRIDLQQPDFFGALARRWLNLTFEKQAWLSTSPIGLFAGATILFVSEDLQNSPERQVFAEPKRDRPALWALLRTYFVMSFPSVFRSKLTIGAEISTGKRVTITANELSRHMITVGRSGRGKSETTFTIVMQAAARLGMPIVYIDGENDPEVKEKLIALATMCNRKSYIFDSMNPADSCAYDAFSRKNITTQKDMVIGLRSRWTEPHYKAFAARFAQTTFKVMAYAKRPVDLVTFSNALSVNALLALARGGVDKTGRYKAMQKEIIGLREIEKQAIESIMSEVSELTNAHFGIAFDIQKAKREERPILNLVDARNDGSIVYIGLPGLSYPESASKLAALVIADLKASLPAAKCQVLIVFDEFSLFANPSTLNLINMGRSFSGSCILATQSFADFLTEESQNFLRQVIGSVNTFAIHELTDPQDAELAAQIFGTKFSVQYTSQIVENQRTGSASARATQEFKIHPNSIKSIGVGKAYILNKDKSRIIRHVKIKRSSPRE